MAYSQILYIGRNTLRHEDENGYDSDEHESREDWADENPNAYPHVFIDYRERPVEVRDLLLNQSLSPKGSSSVLVSYQKEVRDRNSIGQVNRWREGFDLDYFDEILEDIDWGDYGRDEVGERIAYEGEPFVVLNPSDASLNVPLTQEDKINRIREIDESLAERCEAEPELVDQIWSKLQAMFS